MKNLFDSGLAKVNRLQQLQLDLKYYLLSKLNKILKIFFF